MSAGFINFALYLSIAGDAVLWVDNFDKTVCLADFIGCP